jgi:hypothetical protein
MQIPDCPNCSAPMYPTEVRCESCEVEIRARFTPNEFAQLQANELNFLRVFVACEGRIKEMEKALNVSYPTIKNLMVKLKNELKKTTTVNHDSTPRIKNRKAKNAGQDHQH